MRVAEDDEDDRAGLCGYVQFNKYITYCRGESVGSVGADRGYLDDNKEEEREAQGAEGLNKNCTTRESMPPLSRLIRDFRNKYP